MFVLSYSHEAYLDYGGVHFLTVSPPLSARWRHVASFPLPYAVNESGRGELQTCHDSGLHCRYAAIGTAATARSPCGRLRPSRVPPRNATLLTDRGRPFRLLDIPLSGPPRCRYGGDGGKQQLTAVWDAAAGQLFDGRTASRSRQITARKTAFGDHDDARCSQLPSPTTGACRAGKAPRCLLIV